METSILNDTKKVLGIPEGYGAFDIDIIMHINAAFGILNQLGVGPTEAFSIDSAEAKWTELSLPQNQLNLARSYVYLRTRLLFDPPTTSFLLDSLHNQMTELEGRLSFMREDTITPVYPSEVPSESC